MIRGYHVAPVFLVIVVLKLTDGDQESLNYANCQLTNTCFGRTTDDLANERSTTSKITDKETNSNTPTTLTTFQNAGTLVTNTKASLHITNAPSTEDACIGLNSNYFRTRLNKTTAISTATQITTVTNRKFQATESTVVMTTADALKSTYDSKTSQVYTFSSVWKFDKSYCSSRGVVKVKDLIYVLCEIFNEGIQRRWLHAILAYEDNIPYDLLMITFTEEIEDARNMVGIENTSLVYVHDWGCKCIWKIDTVNNIVEKWLSNVGYWSSLSVANDNHLLLLKDSEDKQYLEIYDQDAKLVRSVSLPNDFKGQLRAIQKPNGEFIVSHYFKASIGACVSFLSADGQIIRQFRLRETVGFTDMQLSFGINGNDFASEVFSGNVYFFDWDTGDWNLSDLSVIISNDSERSSRKILSFKNTDGRIIKKCAFVGEIYMQSVWLFREDDYLLISAEVSNDIYLFDTKTLKWSHLGRLPIGEWYYDTKKKQFITIDCATIVHIWGFNKN